MSNDNNNNYNAIKIFHAFSSNKTTENIPLRSCTYVSVVNNDEKTALWKKKVKFGETCVFECSFSELFHIKL